MDKELKAKWVAALRSGDYKQAKDVLHDPATGGYCCYGVLRHVANPNDTRSLNKGSCLTHDQLSEYGLDVPGFERSRLECMNDGIDPDNEFGITQQCSFAQIADWIDANL